MRRPILQCTDVRRRAPCAGHRRPVALCAMRSIHVPNGCRQRHDRLLGSGFGHRAVAHTDATALALGCRWHGRPGSGSM
jgi:hypothetical protein